MQQFSSSTYAETLLASSLGEIRLLLSTGAIKAQPGMRAAPIREQSRQVGRQGILELHSLPALVWLRAILYRTPTTTLHLLGAAQHSALIYEKKRKSDLKVIFVTFRALCTPQLSLVAIFFCYWNFRDGVYLKLCIYHQLINGMSR